DAQVKESDDALIDEEILSIFVEEVDEVLAAVNDACSKLKSNPEDSPSLQELRRAFHTLKGSGRLVGATQIGDLGWAIENLLNKYLEQNIVPQSDDFRLIDLATERLPSLLTAFSEQSGAVDCDDIYGLTESRLQALVASPESNEAEQDEAASSEAVQSESVQSEVVTVEVVQDELADKTDAELDDAIDAQSEIVDVVEVVAEPAPEAVVSAMDDDDDLIDDEILEIFIEEAEEVSETIGNYLPVFLQEFENQEALTELRRAYHTLKGSGRMVGAEDIGETAWAVENMLNRVIDGSILINQDIADVVAYVSELIPNLVEHFKHRTQPTIDLAVLQDHADSLSKGELVPALKNLALESADNASAETSVATDAISEQNSEESVAVELTADASEQTAPEGDPLLGVDQTLLEIFETEVAGHIASIETFVSAVLASQEDTAVDDALSRALHTLKGSAKTASIDCIAEVAVPVEKFIKELRARQLKVSVEIAELMDQALALVKEGLGNIHSAPKTSLSGTAAFLESFAALQQSVFVEPEEDEALESFEGQDPQLVSIFLTEGLDILLDAERIIDDWSENPVSNDSLETLCREVKTLQRGAKVAGLESICELCEAIEGSYHCIDPALAEQNSELISVIKRAHDVLINMMDQVAAGLTAELDNQLLAELKQFAIAACDENVELESDSDLSDSLAELDEHLEQSIPDYQRDESENEQAISEDFDDELAEIFLEEAVDIVSGLDELSGKISGAEASEEALQQLERDFHTLKGGARMASIDAIAELAGALENLFNDILHGQRAMSDQVSEVLTEARAVFAEQMEALEQRSSLPSPDALVQRINTLPKGASEDASTSEDILREESNVSAESTASTESIAPESVADASHSAETNAETSAVESGSTESSTISLADLDPELVEIFL
ncbi:MAG: Hpt domain-containing protein, partial [Amphritea sp.]|nr:Hpt domain-containing protein [Amphritea sp.]